MIKIIEMMVKVGGPNNDLKLILLCKDDKNDGKHDDKGIKDDASNSRDAKDDKKDNIDE